MISFSIEPSVSISLLAVFAPSVSLFVILGFFVVWSLSIGLSPLFDLLFDFPSLGLCLWKKLSILDNFLSEVVFPALDMLIHNIVDYRLTPYVI